MDIARPISPSASAITPERDRMFSVVLLVFWAAVTVWQQWGAWAEDLSAVYIAGWLWHTGQGALIYDAPPAFFGGTADSWQPAMAAMGIENENSFAYVYPPIWAVLTAPLTDTLSPRAFFNAVALVQIPLLAASLWLAGRLLKPARMPWWLWTAIGLVTLNLSIQSHLAIWYNQPTMTVGFLILLAFERLGAGRSVAAGVTLALAAAIKLSPAAFVLIFLIDRQWRATASFAAAGAALGLLSIALAGWPAHLAFLDSLALVKGVAYLVAVNTSLKPLLMAAGSALGAGAPIDPATTQLVYASVPGWVLTVLSGAGIATVLIVGRVVAPLDSALRRGLAVLALSITIPLFGPLGWGHYYVVPMLLLPGLLFLLPPRTAIALGALVGVPSLAAVFAEIGVLPWPPVSYTAIMCTAWLAILATLFLTARRIGRKAA